MQERCPWCCSLWGQQQGKCTVRSQHKAATPPPYSSIQGPLVCLGTWQCVPVGGGMQAWAGAVTMSFWRWITIGSETRCSPWNWVFSRAAWIWAPVSSPPPADILLSSQKLSYSAEGLDSVARRRTFLLFPEPFLCVNTGFKQASLETNSDVQDAGKGLPVRVALANFFPLKLK